MSPGDRCDEVIRLIDEVLEESETESEPARTPTEAVADDLEDGVEELEGHWGVYYLRPSA